MAHEHLTYDDLLRIVELVKSSEQFSEFRLKVGEIEVELRRRGAAGTPAPAAAPPTAAPHTEPVSGESQPAPAGPRAPATWSKDSIVIRAPMVGTFYRAPTPGAPSFVEVGQTVEPATTVCIIEVMKLMNSIPADAHGTIEQILVDDAAPVETGQPLIVLRPKSRDGA